MIRAMLSNCVHGLERMCKCQLWRQPATQLALGSVAILLGTFCVYWPSLGGVFIWDDGVTLTDNPLVTVPGGLWEIWFSARAYDYWPLTYTSLWLEWRLWGMDPTGYRVTNLLLHGAGCIVLWRVLLRLRIPAAWLVAMVFALHPVCVGSAAWISERKNTLSLVFYLLSILWFLQFESACHKPGQGASKWYGLSLAAFLLALLAKTSVVMLPFVLLLCVWWQRTRTPNPQPQTSNLKPPAQVTDVSVKALSLRDAARTVPFFALALIMGLVTVWFQHHRAMGAGDPTGPLLERVVAGSWAIWFYLGKAILPVNLSVLYHRWDVDPRVFISYLPLVAWIGVLFVCWRFRTRWSRPILFGLGYFTVALLPVLGFFDMSYLTLSRVADHWQYLALIGPVTLLVSGLSVLLRRCDSVSLPTRAVIGAGVVGLLALLSSERGRLYADPELLWRDVLAKDPQSIAAYNDLGVALVNKGRLDEALPLLRKSIEMNPTGAAPHNNLGMALFEKGRVEEAIALYEQALQLNSAYTPARFNLAVAQSRSEQWSAAAESYSKVLAIRPDSADAHNNLGNILARLGKTNEATLHYAEAVRLRPGFAEAQNNMGNALRLHGRAEEAVKHYRNAIKARPTYPNARYWLGEHAMMRGRTDEAVEHFAYALAEKPNHAEALTGMARALAAQGDPAAAIQHLDKALKAQPDFSRAHYLLGNILMAQGKTNEVMSRFSSILESQPDLAEAHYFVGIVLRLQGEMRKALEHWRKAVQLKPNWVEVLNNLAWQLATHPDPALRNGTEAVELAGRAVELTHQSDPEMLDTLAAAYAEVGRFADAAETLRKAIALAQTQGDLADMQERLARYVSASEGKR